MSKDEKSSTPIMTRSRSQLSGAYAPGAFFTFEGGLGSCFSIPVNTTRAEISSATKSQIALRINEIVASWFNRAFHCRDTGGNPQPIPPALCIDRTLLNETFDGVRAINLDDFVFLSPDNVGYIPAPLTFVCNACKLFRSYNSIEDLQKDLKVLGSRANCPHPKEKKRQCQWRQLDVIFVHWSGSWEPARPGRWDWSDDTNRVYPRDAQCFYCGSEEFELNTNSPQIGTWYFTCAKCGKSKDAWLQNDKVTLQELKTDFRKFPAAGRMEPISYRASAVHYVQADQFIRFEGDDENLLFLLDPSQDQSLADFIAQRFGFGSMIPSDEEIERQLKEAGQQAEWDTFKSRRTTFSLILNNPAMAAVHEQMRIQLKTEEQRQIQAWIDKKWIQVRTDLPKALKDTLLLRHQHDTVSRYDPFRLTVEHFALERNKLNVAAAANGRRQFVPFNLLDKDLGPENEREKASLEAETSALFRQLGVEKMGLVREFDLCRFSFGHSRVHSLPVVEKHNVNMPVRLNLFDQVATNDGRKHPIYVITQANEAIYVKLDEEAVYAWLRDLNCVDAFEWMKGDQPLAAALLERIQVFNRYLDNLPKGGEPKTYYYVYTLLHTYAHVLMRSVAEFSGLDLGSLGEYLFPADLSLVVYRNGTTMDLGNLSSLWRNENVHFLRHLLEPKTLGCGSGSLCVQRGGACPDCILVPETSCVAQNRLLSRSVLRGGGVPREDGQNKVIRGFFEVANERLRRAGT